MKHQEQMIIVHSEEEIPSFANERDEQEFWATHALSEEMLESFGTPEEGVLPPPRTTARPVSIRIDPDTLARLKVVAEKKHKGYQTLLKEFVTERLYEEEKRLGIITGREGDAA